MKYMNLSHPNVWIHGLLAGCLDPPVGLRSMHLEHEMRNPVQSKTHGLAIPLNGTACRFAEVSELFLLTISLMKLSEPTKSNEKELIKLLSSYAIRLGDTSCFHTGNRA